MRCHADGAKFALVAVLMLAVLVFFDGTNRVSRVRFKFLGKDMLWDAAFLALDDGLLGWLFPSGQLSLWLDTDEIVGVLSPIVRRDVCVRLH